MRDLLPKNENKESGVALMMSLLILSLTMTSAVALSRVILREIQITINATNSMEAFYAADSGIEQALYYIKYNRKTGIDTPLNNLKNAGTMDIEGSNQDVVFTDISTTTTSFIFYDKNISAPAYVDIIDPTGNFPLGGIDWDTNSTDPHYYTLNWSIDSCFPDHASDRLEISAYSFINSFAAEIDKKIAVCNCVVADDNCTEYTDVVLDSRFYRFTLNPLDSTASAISFDVLTNVGNDANPNNDISPGISSNTSVTVDGIYKNAIYRLSVEVPSLLSASNLFSYVIFSEEGLKKQL